MFTKLNSAMMLISVSILILAANITLAHCDSMKGPVVKASIKALETGNINYVLIWVQARDEQEIKNLFEKVLHIRKLNDEAKELADMYFFETVVRVHRMGEGESYTGLKPAGYKPEEGIEAADIAIEKGSVENVLSHLDEKYHQRVKELFNNLQSKKNYNVNDLTAGREYVEAYVHFIHYIEGLFNGEENKVEEHHKH